MGACYSGLGSKTCSLNQLPIDPKNKPIVCENISEIKANKVFDCELLSSSFENLSFDPKTDRKGNKTSMSSQTNRQKIPIPSSKVVPKGSQEFVYNKYKTRRYDAAVDVNKVMIFDNSSTTSISSDCSINLSKSSKSTSSSASNIGRLQTSIPKPSKSRTPTPPIPPKYGLNVRKGNQSLQYNDKSNKFSQNNSSLISDRLNGNQVLKPDNKLSKTKTSVCLDTNAPKASYGPTNYGTSIKYTTQVSGLPRPQTAHIVSTSSHSTDTAVNHKMNASNDVVTRLKQYSDNGNQNIKCDQNLRQIKPYYYGMNNKPYERPNSFNYNRLQTQTHSQSKPAFNPPFNSHNNNQKQIPIAPNGALKPKLDIESNHYQSIKKDEISLNSMSSDNKNQNYIKNSVKPETNSEKTDNNCYENTFLPKSIQRVRELAPLFARREFKPIVRDKAEVKNEKSVDTSTDRNSIISVGTGSETENRDLQYFDDEISDQPELVLNSNIDKKALMKSLNSELEGLKLESSGSPPTPLSSPKVSNMSSPLTTPSVMTNTTTFRKPRPLSLVEMADGSYGLDSPSFRAASQDVIGIKTLLFRLHGLLQNAETLNPFEHNYSPNKFYQQLMIAENEDQTKDNDSDDLKTENLDLKRQIVLQQQIIEDKDRTIRLLQQQMAKYSNINNAFISEDIRVEKVNASSQTERCRNASNINPRAVSDGSNGMLVSFWISNVPAFA